MFSEDVDKWFGQGSDEDILKLVSTKPANANNVLTLHFMATIKGFDDIAETVLKLRKNAYKKEFRYKYEDHNHMVSAASELFSMVRQSMTWSKEYGS